MKIAFAHWDNRIAPVFDTARQIRVIETEAGRIVHEAQETLFDDLMVQKVLRLVQLGVATLVCGAISRPMHGLVAAYGIEVIPFVAGELHEVVQAWLHGQLMRSTFAMPGYRRRGQQRFRAMHDPYQGMTTMWGKGRGMGAGGRRAQRQARRGPGFIDGSMAAGAMDCCVCPRCGRREPWEPGVPCVERRCRRCGTPMTRP